VKLTTHLHLVPRSRMRGAILPLPQYVFMALCLVKHRDKSTFNLPYLGLPSGLIPSGFPTKILYVFLISHAFTFQVTSGKFMLRTYTALLGGTSILSRFLPFLLTFSFRLSFFLPSLLQWSTELFRTCEYSTNGRS
jgi:hypothetical protein